MNGTQQRIVFGLGLFLFLLFIIWIIISGAEQEDAVSLILDLTENESVLVGVFILLFLVRPFTGIPPSILSFFAGVQFGLIIGLPIVIIGSVITGMPAYFLGQKSRSLPDWIPGVKRITQKSEAVVDEIGVYRGMLAASLSPTPLDPIAYAAGLSDVPPRAFMISTGIAAIPWGGAYCYLGVVAQSTVGPSQPPFILVASGALIAMLLVAPAIYRQLQDRLSHE